MMGLRPIQDFLLTENGLLLQEIISGARTYSLFPPREANRGSSRLKLLQQSWWVGPLIVNTSSFLPTAQPTPNFTRNSLKFRSTHGCRKNFQSTGGVSRAFLRMDRRWFMSVIT